MPKKLTQSEMSAKGGKSRWKGKTAKERTEEMSRVAKLGWAKRKSRKWISCKTRQPRNRQRVECKYVGVYGPRICHYWFDGVNEHYGDLNTLASQPATHWRLI